MSIPVTPEDFAKPQLREQWRREKDMIVLKLWSDVHSRTPVDVFVYEPFDFKKELPAQNGSGWPEKPARRLFATKRFWP